MIEGKYNPKEHAKLLYSMVLHQTYTFSNELHVTRVPGGWIYDRTLSSKTASYLQSIFVPYDGEFIE